MSSVLSEDAKLGERPSTESLSQIAQLLKMELMLNGENKNSDRIKSLRKLYNDESKYLFTAAKLVQNNPYMNAKFGNGDDGIEVLASLLKKKAQEKELDLRIENAINTIVSTTSAGAANANQDSLQRAENGRNIPIPDDRLT